MPDLDVAALLERAKVSEAEQIAITKHQMQVWRENGFQMGPEMGMSIIWDIRLAEATHKAVAVALWAVVDALDATAQEIHEAGLAHPYYEGSREALNVFAIRLARELEAAGLERGEEGAAAGGEVDVTQSLQKEQDG